MLAQSRGIDFSFEAGETGQLNACGSRDGSGQCRRKHRVPTQTLQSGSAAKRVRRDYPICFPVELIQVGRIEDVQIGRLRAERDAIHPALENGRHAGRCNSLTSCDGSWIGDGAGLRDGRHCDGHQ